MQPIKCAITFILPIIIFYFDPDILPKRALTVADDAVVGLWRARTAVVAAGDRLSPRKPVRWYSHVRTPREELLEPSSKSANKQNNPSHKNSLLVKHDNLHI